MKGRSKKLHLPWDGPYSVIKRLSDVNYRIQATMGRCRRLVVHFNRLKKCSSAKAHNTRTGSEAGLTDKGLQEAAKLPLPPGNALELVDDGGNEMVLPQEIQEEEHPDAQPPRQEAADPSTQAGADNARCYPLRNRYWDVFFQERGLCRAGHNQHLLC